MALSQEEREYAKQLKAQGLTTNEVAAKIASARIGPSATQTPEPRSTQQEPGLLDRVGNSAGRIIRGEANPKDVATGFTKGLMQGSIDVARGVQMLGQGAIAAVDPRRTFSEVREQQPGLRALNNPDVDEILTAKNEDEFAGKVFAFGAELLLPVKSKVVTSALNRGKSSIVSEVDNAVAGVNDLVEKGAVKLEDALNPIDKGVETVLRRSNRSDFEKYVDAARKSVSDPKNPSTLEVAALKAQEALDTISRKVKTAGSNKSAILDKASVGSKNVGSIVTKFRQSLSSYQNNTILDGADSRILSEINEKAVSLGSDPTAKQVDQFIDFVQSKIYTAQRNLTLDVTDRTTAKLRSITGELNTSLKKQLPASYQRLNAEYAKLIKLQNELNQKLGKEGERGAALMKRVFSPSDNRTKSLFEQVREITNIDLVDEAVLARYTAKLFGDTRVDSLLKSVADQASTGFISNLKEEIVSRLLSKWSGTEAELRKALRVIDERLKPIVEDEVVDSVKKGSGGLLQRIMDTPNKTGGFIKIGGKTFNQIDDATKAELTEAIDYLRLGVGDPKKMERVVDDLAQKYNVNQDWSNQKIADKFQDLIEKTKTSDSVPGRPFKREDVN